MRAAAFVLALLLTCPLTAMAAFKDVLPLYLGSIAQVQTARGTGTAFAVESAPQLTRFLTNQHVVRGASRITLQFPSGEKVEARLTAVDANADLALLEAAGVSVPPLPLWAGADPPLGADLAVVGYPLADQLESVGMDLQPSVSKGILSAVRTTRSGVLFQVDVPINPGNSGGPAMDWDTGAVVGVASSGMSGAEGINFLVGIRTLREFLRTRPAPPPTPMASESGIEIPEALEFLGLTYSMDAEGDYRITFDAGNGRTQTVYIRGKKETYGALTIVEIFSPALNVDGKLAPELASKLMLESQDCKIGGWQMRGGPQIEFSIKVSDALTAEQLGDLLDYVLFAADRLEKEITGADNF